MNNPRLSKEGRLELIEFSMYGDGIHLTVAHEREWSYGFKPDNKTVPLPCIWSHRMTTNEKVTRRKLSLLELA